jgi:hypothetical protein
METKTTKPRQSKQHKKAYTFDVICSFDFQYTFTESEVKPDPEGHEGDFIPTDEAIAALEKELTKAIGYNYPVSDLNAEVGSAQIGIMEE